MDHLLSFGFDIRATDQYGCFTQRTLNFTVSCPAIAVAPVSGALPGGSTGSVYSQTITASGGTGPYTFAVSSGSLPTGLSLASGGALTGTRG